MKLGVLFSGGKDSTYSAYLKKEEIVCLISIYSKNEESYMFHTPSISKVEKQAEVMNLPLIKQITKGEKEIELKDLEKAIKKAIKKYRIEGIVTGALYSVYQASRIQNICDKLKIKCINPIWHKNQIDYLKELVREKFEIIIIGVFAYPLTKEWIGRKIDNSFIKEVEDLEKKYKINPAGEGGEFETFVLNCPLFSRPLKIKDMKIFGKDHSWKAEIELY